VRSKKDDFYLGKKMIVDKREMSSYVSCENPVLNEAEKEKKNLRNQRETEILRPFSIIFFFGIV